MSVAAAFFLALFHNCAPIRIALIVIIVCAHVYVAPPPLLFYFPVPLLQLSLTFYKLSESCTSVNISLMPSLRRVVSW
jgi:predicted cobalt transporter CbtA